MTAPPEPGCGPESCVFGDLLTVSGLWPARLDPDHPLSQLQVAPCRPDCAAVVDRATVIRLAGQLDLAQLKADMEALGASVSVEVTAVDTRWACPACGARSSHPEDKANGYCGRCHAFTGG